MHQIIRIKLQQLQQQDLASSLDVMVQTATNTFYNREQEKERGKACPDIGRPPGKPYDTPQLLQGQGMSKCLICRQARHWVKECLNLNKSPRTACHKCHQLGHWAALCPRDPRASRSSTKPSLTMVQED